MKTNMRDTSLDAYNDIRESLGDKQIAVLNTIEKLGQCNDKQIAAHLNWSINRVTPRRNELLAMNKITDLGTRKDPESGRSVHFWSYGAPSISQCVPVHQNEPACNEIPVIVNKDNQVTLF